MRNRINHILAMIYKEFVYMIRDDRMRIVVFAVPIIQALILGYAVNMDLREVKTAVVNYDYSSESGELISKLFSSGVFQLTPTVDMSDAEDKLISGKVSMLVVIPKGFEKALVDNKPSPLQIILDATNSVNAGMASGYLSKVIGLYQSDFYARHNSIPLDAGVNVNYRSWFNDNFESRDFFVPSMLAMLLMIITVLLSGMAIVREKENGTMEQLSVSPITAMEFIAGKTIPFVVVSFFDVIVITLLAVFWFNIPLRGSVGVLGLASLLYILSTLSIGLVISAISSTQQQATLSTFMAIFPLILLSGFAFPIENMPIIIQYVNKLNPMIYYLDVIRGVFLKGLGFSVLYKAVITLGVLGVVYFTIAVLFLRKRLA